MLIGESPEFQDGMMGYPFIGPAGQLLTQFLREVRIDINECSTAFVTQCSTPKGVPPEADEIKACNTILDHYINKANPKIIIPIGNIALKAITKKSGITKYNGHVLESVKYPGKTIIPIISPQFVLRDPRNSSLIRHGLSRVKDCLAGKQMERLSKVTYVDTYEKFDLMMKDLSSKKQFAVDIETSTGKWLDGYIVCISFSNQRGESYVLPWIVGDEAYYHFCRTFVLGNKKRLPITDIAKFCSENGLNHPKFKWENTDVKVRLSTLLADESITKILHNYAFDYKFLDINGLTIKGKIYDTMIMHHQLDERRRTHGLKECAMVFTPYGQYEKELEKILVKKKDKIFKEEIRDSYALFPLEILVPYAGTDADATLILWYKFLPQIMQEGLYNIYHGFLFPLTQMLMQTEKNGMFVDTQLADKYEKILVDHITGTEAKLNEYTQNFVNDPVKKPDVRGVNYKSPKQLCKFMYDYLKLSPVKWKDKKKLKPSTDEEALRKLSAVSPFCELLLDRRKKDKVLTTYVRGVKRNRWGDGKVHANFYIHGTLTGRLSSANPNCFSDDTEILTKRGWIHFSELIREGPSRDLVAQYDQYTQLIDFTYPLNYISYNYNGNMINIKTEEQIDLLVTPDHRCLLENRKTKNIYSFDAQEYPEDYKQYNAGIYVGGNLSFRLSQLVLIAAFQADGHLRKQDGILEFCFHKERKINRLKENLNLEGISFKERAKSKKRPNDTVISISRESIPEWLIDKKYWGNWILDLNSESFKFLAEEIFLWDGLYVRKTNYSSSVKSNTDFVQILQVLNNRRAKIREYKYGPNKDKSNWQIDVANTNYCGTTNRELIEIPYNSTVYCITMPKSTVIVRRNGRVAITNQCQNMPRPPVKGDGLYELGINIKDLFISEDSEYLLVETDYSQAELRLIAEYSKDANLYSAFMAGRDPHAELAVRIYHKDKIPLMESGVDARTLVTKEERQKAKTANFALCYGKYPKSFAEENNLTLVEAQHIFDVYWATFSGIKEWKAKVLEQARKDNFFRTFFGRKRRLETINSTDEWVRGQAEREGINFVIQSQASDNTLWSGMKMLSQCKTLGIDARTVSFVHDSVVYLVHKSRIQEFLTLLRKTMLSPPGVSIPMESEVKVGNRLGSLKEWVCSENEWKEKPKKVKVAA